MAAGTRLVNFQAAAWYGKCLHKKTPNRQPIGALTRACLTGPEDPVTTNRRVDRTTTLPVQTALATSWSPFRSLRRHRRLSLRVRNWGLGLGPAAGFRCHRHRSCRPFTSFSACSSTLPRKHPQAAPRDRSRPEPFSVPCVPYRFTSLPIDITNPIDTTPRWDEPVNKQLGVEIINHADAQQAAQKGPGARRASPEE
jgi:hypothetical protein